MIITNLYYYYYCYYKNSPYPTPFVHPPSSYLSTRHQFVVVVVVVVVIIKCYINCDNKCNIIQQERKKNKKRREEERREVKKEINRFEIRQKLFTLILFKDKKIIQRNKIYNNIYKNRILEKINKYVFVCVFDCISINNFRNWNYWIYLIFCCLSPSLSLLFWLFEEKIEKNWKKILI